MGFNMENHEILFTKIEAKEKEWQEQVKLLQTKTAELDPEKRVKIEQQLNKLDAKLKEIAKRTGELKKLTGSIKSDLTDRIVYAWIELFTEIDNAMLKLKNK